ncbi:hypothetical protein ACL9RL_03820 [Plantibacter sp. Mn2098]|uniref:hypothetical protein n=1 Tax=Plantibacter sp. Mn2098 TaxID=3395266 RepID=UPI003BC1A0DC
MAILAARSGPAAIIAAIAIGTTFAIAFLATMVTCLTMDTPIPDLSLLVTAPVQLLGAAVGGIATVAAVMDGLGTDAVFGLSAFWMPAGLTATLTAALFCAAVVDERRAPSTVRARWISSALTGLVLAMALLISTAVARAVVSPGGFTVGATTASFTLVIGSLLIGTLVPFLARTVVAGRATGRPLSAAGGSMMRAFWPTVTAASVYAVVGIFVVTVVGSLAALSSGTPPNALISAVLWGPTAAFAGFALLNFSAVTVGITPASVLTGNTTTWLPTSASPWVSVLALILLVVLVVSSSLLLMLRRPISATTVPSWFVTVGVFAGLGVAVSVFGSITGQLAPSRVAGLFDSSFGSQTTSLTTIGAAPWTFLVFAVIGVAVEASARFIAPTIASALPPRMTSMLASFGRSVPVNSIPAPVADALPLNETTPTAMTSAPDATPSNPAASVPTAHAEAANAAGPLRSTGEVPPLQPAPPDR